MSKQRIFQNFANEDCTLVQWKYYRPFFFHVIMHKNRNSSYFNARSIRNKIWVKDAVKELENIRKETKSHWQLIEWHHSFGGQEYWNIYVLCTKNYLCKLTLFTHFLLISSPCFNESIFIQHKVICSSYCVLDTATHISRSQTHHWIPWSSFLCAK